MKDFNLNNRRTGYSGTLISLIFGISLLCLPHLEVSGQPTFKKIFAVTDNIYLMVANKQADGAIKVDIFFGDAIDTSRSKSFNFYSESFEVFKKSFSASVVQVTKKTLKSCDTVNIRKEADLVTSFVYKELLTYEISLYEETPRAGSIILFKDVKIYPSESDRIPCKKKNMIKMIKRVNDLCISNLNLLSKKIDTISDYKCPDISIKDSVLSLISKKNDLNKRLSLKGTWCEENLNELKKLRKANKDKLKDIKSELKQIEKKSLKCADLEESIKQLENSQEIKKLPQDQKKQFSNCLDSIKCNCPCKPVKIPRRELKHYIREGSADLALIQSRIDIFTLWLDLLRKRKKLSDQKELIDSRLGSLNSGLKIVYQKLNKETYDYFKNPSYGKFFNSSIKDTVSLNVLKNYFKNKSELNKTINSDEISDSLTKAGCLILNLQRKLIDAVKTFKDDSLSKKYLQQGKLGHTVDSIKMILRALPINDQSPKKTKLDSIHTIDTLLLQKINDSIDKIQNFTSVLEQSQNNMVNAKRSIDSILLTMELYKINASQENLISKQIKELENKEKDLLSLKLFKIDSVQIEFNDGVLKNIVVVGKYQGNRMIFTNNAPIQFTGITHFENIYDIDLYDLNRQCHTIRLGDVFTYIPALHVDAEDYCPSDSVYQIPISSSSGVEIKQAMKEKLNQILEAKTYTDFVGFGLEQPNGLIQFEISKKIPLFTNRIKPSKNYRSFVSFGSYYEPIFTMAKIEQTNRYFYPVQTDKVSGKLDISTIDVFKYSSMRLAAINLNIFNWEITEAKSALEINGGFSLQYTPIKDSVSDPNSVRQWGAVSGMPFTEVKFLIKPDTRYGISLSANLGWLFLWDTKLKMINDPDHPTDSKSYNRKLLSFKFDAFYKPFHHSENAIFFRVMNMHTFPMAMNYFQVQLGFAFNVFGRKAGQK